MKLTIRSIQIFGILTMFFFTQNLIGQSQLDFTLKCRVVDAVTNEKIVGANIFDPINDVGTSTNKKGVFTLKIEQLPAQLEITYVGYEDFFLNVTKEIKQEVTVHLTPKISDLPEAVVQAERKPEEVFQKRYSVTDFVFYGTNILLLINDLETNKIRLELQSPEGEVMDSIILEELSGRLSFHKSCLGDINIISGNKVYPVVLEEEYILGIGQNTPYHSYNWEVKKCVLANEENVYYQFYDYYDQLIKYHLFAKDRDTNYVFSTVYNEEQIRLLYEDMMPLIGIDNSTVDMISNSREEMEIIRNAQETLDGRKHFFYQPIYCPLFQYGKNLIVFDHVGGELLIYSNNGTSLETIPISYQENKNWDKIILSDIISGTYFTTFSTKTGKQLAEINTIDGSMNESVYFSCKEVEKIAVMNGRLFLLEKFNDSVFGFTVNKLKRLELNINGK